MDIMDILHGDAFNMISMTAEINNTEHVPGRAGEVAFAGTTEGVATATVSIESIGDTLDLIPTTRHDEPAPQETLPKANLRALTIPHIKLEKSVLASSVIGVREIGTVATFKSVRGELSKVLAKMARRHDLTLEHHRLGALNGLILDSDGSVLLDLFDAFSVTEEDPILMDEILARVESTDVATVRATAQAIYRKMVRNLKMPWPASARIHSFTGDNFFDRLVDCGNIKGVYDGYAEAERRMGDNYAFGTYYYAGVFWENYRGTDDGSTVTIPTDDARLFPVGVPGLYAEYMAPADFAETVNSSGLPYYAKVAGDGRFNREFYVHTQQNPLPICRRPKVLMRATIASE